jgi:hypothetical protein
MGNKRTTQGGLPLDAQALNEQPPGEKAVRTYRIPKLLRYLLGLLLICGFGCGTLYWLIELRPQYVELAIPESEEMITLGYTQRSVLEWVDGPRSFLWRQETIWFRSEGQDSQTVWRYFDQHLAAQGWVQVDDRLSDSCHISAPETRFLNPGPGGYVVYVREGREVYPNNVFCHGAEVCLAILEGESGSTFDVVLTSRNPSFLTEYGECMG